MWTLQSYNVFKNSTPGDGQMMQREMATTALNAIQGGYRLWPVCELCEQFNQTIPPALNHGTEDALNAVFNDWQSHVDAVHPSGSICRN